MNEYVISVLVIFSDFDDKRKSVILNVGDNFLNPSEVEPDTRILSSGPYKGPTLLSI